MGCSTALIVNNIAKQYLLTWENGTINFVNRELNQKLMEAESELDDVRNQKSAGEMDTDSELGRKYTDHL